MLLLLLINTIAPSIGHEAPPSVSAGDGWSQLHRRRWSYIDNSVTLLNVYKENPETGFRCERTIAPRIQRGRQNSNRWKKAMAQRIQRGRQNRSRWKKAMAQGIQRGRHSSNRWKTAMAQRIQRGRQSRNR